MSSTADSGEGSLRAALADASCTTITFAASLNGQIITLTSGRLNVSHDVSITGPGASLLTVRRDPSAPAFRIFDVPSGKTAAIAGLTISGGRSIGGGILNAGTLTLAHSTVSGNSAFDSQGRGIYNSANLGVVPVVTVTSSTIWGNSIYTFDGTITLKNTIVAGSPSGVNCGRNRDEGGTITDGGYNLDGGANCAFSATGSLSKADPLLGPLANNGGPTMTHALLAGSPAINAIPNGTNGCGTDYTTDQRGVSRPQGGACDIGTFEYEPPAQPGFQFTGFFAPVDNLPVVNVVKAGQAVPVKFSLGGDFGLAIFESGYPKSVRVACDTSAPQDAVTETVTAGSSSLSYDAATGRYSYVWKTDKGWANTCRVLTLKLSDGSEHVASFRFTR